MTVWYNKGANIDGETLDQYDQITKFDSGTK